MKDGRLMCKNNFNFTQGAAVHSRISGVRNIIGKDGGNLPFRSLGMRVKCVVNMG